MRDECLMGELKQRPAHVSLSIHIFVRAPFFPSFFREPVSNQAYCALFLLFFKWHSLAHNVFLGRYEFNGRPLKVHYDKFSQSSQNNPLVGISPQAVPSSLSPYDPLSQLTSSLSRLEVISAHNGRPHASLDSLAQSHLDFQRSRLEMEGLTSTQLDALLARPRSSSFKSPSLTGPVLSQSPPHMQSSALLQPQGQSLNAGSLGASIAQSVLPSATSLSQPHSLTGSPNPVSAKASSSSSSLRNFGTATDLTLVTDLNDIKLTPDSFTSLTSFGSPQPSLSASSSQTSSFSSCGSRRPNLSTASRGDALNDGSQRTSCSSSARPSFGAANADKPSLCVSASERSAFGACSERFPFGSGNSQRLSTGLTTSQNPGLGASSQRPAAHLNPPFSEEDGPTPSTSIQMSTLRKSKHPSLAPAAIPLSLPPSKGSHPGSAGLSSKTASPPSFVNSGSISKNWSDLSRVESPESRGSQASPSQTSSQIPLRSTSEEVSPEASLLAKSILNTDSPSAHDTSWGTSRPQLRKEPLTSKANGTVDYVTTALGALGMRRASRAQSKQAEEKRAPSGEQQPQAPSAPAPQGNGRKSAQSSHRHPGPISLPPPTAFALPPGVVFSPHAHPQSPVYYPGYPLSPVHPHPIGSPLHHPLGSPLHPPAVHSPLQHPGHPQYGAYPHHATPVHYGVITPHGLPPITPSMPPFTFLPPHTQSPPQNGQGREGDERRQHVSQNEGSQTNPSKWDSTVQVPPPYYPQSSNAPQQRMQYTQVHPPMFSPGIPLSPGIMIPLAPGIVSPGVPMASVPVPMTPGVALTPGVTMTPGAFWSHAPWINPAPGAPVHAPNGPNEQLPGGIEGYFPPVSQPSVETGYFPPVPNVANDILKEGHRLASGSDGLRGDNAHEAPGYEEVAPERSPRRPSSGMSLVSSSDYSKSPQDANRKGGAPRVMKRANSAHCEGVPKRNGLLHRESDP